MSHLVPAGTLCDECLDNGVETLATRAILAEDTGFGREYSYYCNECLSWYGILPRHEQHGMCEWCRDYSHHLRWMRDTREGYHSRKYKVCPRCEREEFDRKISDRDRY